MERARNPLKVAEYPEEKLLLVEDALSRFFPSADSHSQVVYQAMEYSLFPGGKRFRPVLLLQSAEVFGLPAERVLPAACAIEFVHTYSLIHDDLPAIDDDDLRRGKPTCHRVFGEDLAILAGDALFAEAFYLIAKHQSGQPEPLHRIMLDLATATGVRGMVGGQVVDIISTGKDVSPEVLDYIHQRKTGELIKVAAQVGPILAEVAEEQLAAVGEYAAHLGLAFQITDDILDVAGETETLGKQAGSDERQLKATFPRVFGLKKATSLAEKSVERACEALKRIDCEATALADLARFVIERKS